MLTYQSNNFKNETRSLVLYVAEDYIPSFRIGAFAMLMTLELNGISLQFSQEELIELGLSVADGSWNYDKILDWIKTHAK